MNINIKLEKTKNEWKKASKEFEDKINELQKGKISKSKLSLTGSEVKHYFRSLEEIIKAY